MQLVHPSLEWQESFTSALAEFDHEGTQGFWNWREPVGDSASYISQVELHARGENLPPGVMPSRTFWLVEDDRFIGHINVRLRLTPRLTLIGGHVGYAVRPSERGKGYGSSMLQLAMPHVRELGIENALLTCDIENAASRKIIEKAGGVFRDEILVEGRPICRYLLKT